MANYGTDADLAVYEPDIANWRPAAWDDFGDLHALAKTAIDEWLRSKNIDPPDTADEDSGECDYVATDATQFTPASCYWVLGQAFRMNTVDDAEVAFQKAKAYRDEYEKALVGLRVKARGWDQDADDAERYTWSSETIGRGH